MCDSVIVSRATGKPIEVQPAPHRLVYVDHLGQRHELLSGIPMDGRINFAAAHRLTDQYGIKRGFMFVVGEC